MSVALAGTHTWNLPKAILPEGRSGTSLEKTENMSLFAAQVVRELFPAPTLARQGKLRGVDFSGCYHHQVERSWKTCFLPASEY